jgi:steroid delta-isomerase-like uncharacterized protein
MNAAENETLVRRLFDAWNGADLAIVDEVVAPDAVPAHEGTSRGRESWKEAITTYRSSFPDIRYEIDDLIAGEDKVTVRWTATGTDTVGFMGMPATGRRATVCGINIYRIESGLLAEHWDQWDLAGLLQQLGALPSPTSI